MHYKIQVPGAHEVKNQSVIAKRPNPNNEILTRCINPKTNRCIISKKGSGTRCSRHLPLVS